MVDLSGPDYSDDSTAFDDVKTVVGSTMPIALHESNAVSPAAWFPASPFVLWNVWAGYETMAASTVKAGMTDSHTITRDLVPNLK